MGAGGLKSAHGIRARVAIVAKRDVFKYYMTSQTMLYCRKDVVSLSSPSPSKSSFQKISYRGPVFLRRAFTDRGW
eukprot:754869-Hanusia_phi.AAC.3